MKNDLFKRAILSEDPLEFLREKICTYSFDVLKEQIIHCDKCSKATFERKSIPYGNPNADIMIINDVADFNESALSFFNQLVRNSGISINDVYITNVVRCEFKRMSDGYIRKPSEEERKTCKKFLDKEILFVSPKIIVAMGASVIREYCKEQDKKFTSINGIKTIACCSVQDLYQSAKYITDEEIKNKSQEMMDALLYASSYIKGGD